MENTKQLILQETIQIVSQSGIEGVSMRTLAQQVGLAPSVLYHHFQDKEDVLTQMSDYAARQLGQLRSQLPASPTATAMLEQRIEFQLDHAPEVIAILKFYLYQRKKYPKNEQGYIPETAYRHITEVLQHGHSTGEFMIHDINADAKVITHAINGFLLEYFPDIPTGSEKKQLISSIHQFIIRALVPQ